MITFNGVSKRFGKVRALHDVSFTALPGRVTGVLGPNGSGKTTLLRMISGLCVPDEGEVSVMDMTVSDKSVNAVRANLGMVPHVNELYGRLTAREHLELSGELYGIDPGRVVERTEYLAKQLGMQEIIDRRTEGFSAGQVMRVALARALLHEPQVLVLDEATNGLDVQSVLTLRALVKEYLEEREATVIFCSHILHEVEHLCRDIVLIRDGELRATGTIPDLLSQAGETDFERAFVKLVETDAAPSHAPAPALKVVNK
jgi:sodium transport system ATP-binding protein